MKLFLGNFESIPGLYLTQQILPMHYEGNARLVSNELFSKKKQTFMILFRTTILYDH